MLTKATYCRYIVPFWFHPLELVRVAVLLGVALLLLCNLVVVHPGQECSMHLYTCTLILINCLTEVVWIGARPWICIHLCDYLVRHKTFFSARQTLQIRYPLTQKVHYSARHCRLKVWRSMLNAWRGSMNSHMCAIFTACVSGRGNTIGPVCLSVCLLANKYAIVCMYPVVYRK